MPFVLSEICYNLVHTKSLFSELIQNMLHCLKALVIRPFIWKNHLQILLMDWKYLQE